MLAVLLIGVVVASPLIYSVFYTDYSERALVAAALAEQVDLKQQISAELLQGKPVVTLSGTQRTPLYTRAVDANGTIALYLSKIKTTVVLTPSAKDNEVQWSCSGDVMRNLVPHCRWPMADAVLPLVEHAKGAN